MDIIEPKITLSLDSIRRGIFLFAENFKGSQTFFKKSHWPFFSNFLNPTPRLKNKTKVKNPFGARFFYVPISLLYLGESI